MSSIFIVILFGKELLEASILLDSMPAVAVEVGRLLSISKEVASLVLSILAFCLSPN